MQTSAMCTSRSDMNSTPLSQLLHIIQSIWGKLRCSSTLVSVLCITLFFGNYYSDLHSIPAELRVVLERCLSEDPSPELVETYMPDLRKVLYKLLKGLQDRQELWRASIHRPSMKTPVEATWLTVSLLAYHFHKGACPSPKYPNATCTASTQLRVPPPMVPDPIFKGGDYIWHAWLDQDASRTSPTPIVISFLLSPHWDEPHLYPPFEPFKNNMVPSRPFESTA